MSSCDVLLNRLGVLFWRELPQACGANEIVTEEEVHEVKIKKHGWMENEMMNLNRTARVKNEVMDWSTGNMSRHTEGENESSERLLRHTTPQEPFVRVIGEKRSCHLNFNFCKRVVWCSYSPSFLCCDRVVWGSGLPSVICSCDALLSNSGDLFWRDSLQFRESNETMMEQAAHRMDCKERSWMRNELPDPFVVRFSTFVLCDILPSIGANLLWRESPQ